MSTPRISDDDLAHFLAAPPLPADLWALDPSQMLKDLGLTPDPWQVRLLRMKPDRALLNCSRQSGKTTVTALLALHDALFCPRNDSAKDVLLFAPAGRQSDELLRRITSFYARLGRPVPRASDRVSQLDFVNGARIVPLPNNEEAIRGYTPRLVVIDEAARVPDTLYRAVRPMLAASRGRLVVLSTPFGKRGFFFEEWRGTNRWERIKVTAAECPRIDAAFLEEERRALGEVWYQQEYFCSFEQAEGIVYPEWNDCLVDLPELKDCRAYAGVDFGFNNPCAFVVGLLDADVVLWLVEEVYGRRMTDDDLIRRVKPLCERYQMEAIWCDSEAAGSIVKFRRADLPARKAFKKIDLGIRAVAARLRTGRLRCSRTLKNTIEEAGLYRYYDEHERELRTDNPIKDNDHCMDAIRYLVAGLDRVRDVWGLERKDEPEPEPELVRELLPPQQRYVMPSRRSPAERPSEEEEERRRQREHLDNHGWEDWMP
jgi:hypothetical protein